MSRLQQPLLNSKNYTAIDESLLIDTKRKFIDMGDIFEAIRKGDLASAKQLILKNGVGVTDKDGWSLLHLCALHAKADIMNHIIEKGGDLNARDQKGSTPLHQAAFEGKHAVAQILCEKGADVHAVNGLNNSPLHFAAGKGHLAIVQSLCFMGARLDKNTNGKTPTDLANEKGFPEVGEYLKGHEKRLAAGGAAAAPAGPCNSCALLQQENSALKKEMAMMKEQIKELQAKVGARTADDTS